ncbi:MAG: TonB-dependent receptor [Ferruginibacter sp.]
MRKITPRFFRNFCVFLILLLTSGIAYAQTSISGRITDAGGNGIEGITVTVKGTGTGTSSAADGSFSLSLPSGARTLVFSGVGYTTQELAIAGRTSFNVTMAAAAATDLNEVVIVGYGTARKKDLTGSVATVSSKDFQKGAIATPEQLIAAKVPGVSVISNGGQPGSGSQIRVRGGSSLSASNNPLIVVDGIPLSGDAISGSPNPLSLINPNDIESFTILKDASAAAIYGTRAANGVIIITTKKGKGGKLKVNFTTLASLSKATNYVDVLSADQVRSIVNASGNQARIAQLGTANTNWQDEIYRAAFSTDNNISVSGGIKNLPYRLSLGYQNVNGILLTDNYQRASVGLNLSPTFLDNHLKVDLNVKGTSQDVRYGNQDAIGAAISFDPTQPVYSGNNRYGGYYQWTDAAQPTGLMLNRASNPLGLLEQTNNTWKPMRSIGNIQFDYKMHFLPELRANLNLGYDIARSTGNTVISDSAANTFTPVVENGNTVIRSGNVTKGKQEVNNQVMEFYLNYLKDIKSIRSTVDVTAGYSYNFYKTTGYNYRSYFGNGDTIPGTQAPLFAKGKDEHSLISVFGRLNYTFNQKYLLTATVRRDGSSRFAKQNKWGTFPSVAFAWKLSDEDFLKSSKAVSDLKLRIGYGVTGQQDGIGNYGYLPVYSSFNNPAYFFGGQQIPIIYSPNGYNGDLKWEETATYNAGLDFGFLNNRINGTVDFYYKKTTDLLNYVAQPTGTNFDLYVTTNIGDMTNKGVEFNLNTNPIRKKDLSWDVNFNITYNKNEITRLTVNPDDKDYPGILGAKPQASNLNGMVSSVGGPKNVFYLFKQVYDQDGKPIEGVFEDLNRDGLINENDRYRTKQADPNIFTGFSTNVTYKKFNAGFVLRGSFNNYIFNDIKASRGRYIDIVGAYHTGNASASYLQTGTVGEYNRNYQPLSDYYLENASFVRMDNFTVGYNIGKVFNSKANLRVNGAVQNVFIITKYSGLDPESTYGMDQNLYPRPRTYSVGFNLDF